MTLSSDDSITHWIHQLGNERNAAAAKLWGRYESRLLALAARHLSRQVRRVSDPEDVVASVFESFFERAARGQIPADANRDDLWRLLATIVQFKAISHSRRELRQKRGGGRQIEASDPAGEHDLLAEVTSRELSPALAAEVTESVDVLLGLLDKQQVEIVALKLEGNLDREIAERLGVSVPTVERRLRLVRSRWQAWTSQHTG